MFLKRRYLLGKYTVISMSFQDLGEERFVNAKMSYQKLLKNISLKMNMK